MWLCLRAAAKGIPLVLMEAMVRGRIVLAPAITGIPEIVVAGKTGFLYAPGALEDFVDEDSLSSGTDARGGSQRQ